MKKLISSLILVLCLAGLVVAQYQSDMVTIDKGDYAKTYEIFVATTAYEVIDDAYSSDYTDWLIVNRSTNTVWYDFDTTISTWTTAKDAAGSALKRGYVTGRNPSLLAGEHISSQGRNAMPIYFRTDDVFGVFLEVTLFKRTNTP